MNDLPFPQEADHVVHIRVITETQNVVICGSGLLFGSHVLRQICDHIALYSHAGRTPGETRGRRGINARGMIHKIGIKSRFLYLLHGEIPCKLMHNRADHLQVSQFLCTYIRVKMYIQKAEKGRIQTVNS